MDEVKYRMNTAEAVFAIILAVIADILSFFPGINDIVDVIAEIVFTIFFFINGVNILFGKGGTGWVSWGFIVVEAIPGVSWIPGYTIQVCYAIRNSRKEDRVSPPKTTGPSLFGYAAMSMPVVGQLVTGAMVAKTAVKTKSLPGISFDIKNKSNVANRGGRVAGTTINMTADAATNTQSLGKKVGQVVSTIKK